jgi:wobble nucleotide-excising tRNase
MSETTFANLDELAAHLRRELGNKKYVLLYAYNGTGKTRLSMTFKNAGKHGDERDTLYFNAFTEDLFTWDNDLDSDNERVLKINATSRFFSGIEELEMENRIRPFLRRYEDFDFSINYEQWTISFSRVVQGETIDNIKVSRSEENIFIWCFFLAIVQLTIDNAVAYNWVKYIYIDDPISSLDDNNVIAVASHLVELLEKSVSNICAVISSHHALFFNVIYNQLHAERRNSKAIPYFLSHPKGTSGYELRSTQSTPFFHHIAMLTELYKAEKTGKLYTYHFNILRSILEKTASFHGFNQFSDCVKQDDDDPDGIVYARLINILSHGNYSLYEPQEMVEENKAYFKKILGDFMSSYTFNPTLFPQEPEEVEKQ